MVMASLLWQVGLIANANWIFSLKNHFKPFFSRKSKNKKKFPQLSEKSVQKQRQEYFFTNLFKNEDKNIIFSALI